MKQRLSRGRKALRDSVADRVESALVRVGKRPDLRAGVLVAVAASTAATTKTAAAAAGSGKVLALMTAKQLGIGAVGILAIAGGAWFFSQRGDAKPATPATPAITSGSSVSTSTGAAEAAATAAGGKITVRKIDEARRTALLASIRAEQERRVAARTGGASSGATPPPKLETPDLDKEYVRAAVRELVPLLMECYQEGLERDPAMQGKLVVEFTIEGEPGVGGIVGESKVDPSTSDITDATVQQCIGETMHALQIDPPASGGTVTVRYPFEFRPAPEPDAAGSDAGSAAGSGTMPPR